MAENTDGGDQNHTAFALLAIISILAVISVLSWYGLEHEKERDHAASSYHQARIVQCLSAKEKSSFECQKIAITPAYQVTQDAYDLKAQQDMAKWALLMLIVTGVGVVFVAMTLSASQKMLLEAKDATKAAWVSGNSAREIGQKQCAAYVHVTRAYIPKKEIPTLNALAGMGEKAAIVIEFKNIGSTIGKNISIKFGLFDEPVNGAVYRSMSYPREISAPNVAPGQQSQFPIIADLDQIIDESRCNQNGDNDGGEFRLLRGELFYDDVFGNTFRTAFIFWVMWGKGYSSSFSSDRPCAQPHIKLPAFDFVRSASSPGKIDE